MAIFAGRKFVEKFYRGVKTSKVFKTFEVSLMEIFTGKRKNYF